MHRRLVSLAVAVGVALSASPAHAAAVPFRDILPGYWAAPAIAHLAASGIVEGYRDGTFRPYDPIRRAEFTALVYRLVLGGNPPTPAQAPYADVPPGAWYAGVLAAGKARSWFLFPTPGNAFQPDRPITREEATSLLAVAFLGQPGADTSGLSSFTDAGRVAPWAAPALAAAIADGLLAGYPDHTLRPEAPIRRAEAAALLDRARAQLLTVGDQRFRIVTTLAMVASAYGSGEAGIGPTTATGTPARPGECAVDPAVIPLGSYLWVTGYQTPYLPAAGILEHAEDTGGDIHGNRIDLYMTAPNREAYDDFGLQTVTAYLLAPLP